MQPIREFDHLMCGMKDINAAGDTYEALGFTVGPVTPLDDVGVANRRILFTPKQENVANYIEFMQLGGAAGKIPPYLQKWLAGSLNGREGVHCFIMRTDDARACCAHFEKRHQQEPDGGFAPILLEIDFELPGPQGQLYAVGFSNCVFPDLEPPLYISTSQIRTLDFYLDAEWRSHANGTRSWTGGIAVSPTPLDTAKALQNIWGGEVKLNNEIAVVGPGEIPLKIFTPDRFHDTYGVAPMIASGNGSALPYNAGFHLSVDDLDHTRNFLLERDVKLILKDDKVIVPPELAHGMLICFEQD